jgi:aminoglycoside 2''-phosphotransferase
MAEPDLADRLQRRLPELSIAPLRLLDVGFGSTVVETADGIVFRVARHPRAAGGHTRELQLLPQLGGRLPVDVPVPRWRLEPDADFLHGAIGYRKLRGEPLTAGGGTHRLAEDVALFLRALHRLQDIDAESRELDLDSLREATLPALEHTLEPAELARLDCWWHEIRSDAGLRTFEPALRHGDLWYENLLVAGGRLVGVLDWEGAAFADPAQDFAPLPHLGDPFSEAVLGLYGASDAFRLRAQRHWELRELYGIRLALELDDADELADSVRKLRAGPILHPE